MKALFALVVLAALGVAGIYFFYLRPAHETPVEYRTVEVQRGDLHASISATGIVEPEELVDVGAQVAGKINALGADPDRPGQTIDYTSRVEQGTVLAQIDDAIYKAQVEQARANLKRADADVLTAKAKEDQAERDWRRAESLAASKTITQAELDLARSNYQVAQAAMAVGASGVGQAKAALKLAEIQLDYTIIRSPVKGVIVDRRVNVGQTVVASLNAPSMFLIAKDLRRMQIWGNVNEADIGHIHVGQDVRFVLDAYPQESFHGSVTQIRLNGTMTQNVVTYTVVVTADTSDGRLIAPDAPLGSAKRPPESAQSDGKFLFYPYLTANLQFQTGHVEGALLVPAAALRWRPRTAAGAAVDKEVTTRTSKEKMRVANAGRVWVEEGGAPRPIDVQVGLSDGQVTAVTSSELADGAEVIIGEVRRDNGAEGAANPFTPRVFGGGGPRPQ